VVLNLVGQTLREVYDVALAHANQDTLIVGSSLCLGARVASDEFSFPMATIHLSPICIRSCERLPVLPGGWNGNWIPRFARPHFWNGADKWIINPMIAPPLNAFRAEKNLPPVTSVQGNYWNSPLRTIGLWPEWFYPVQKDYPPQVRLAGFPLYDESDHVALDARLIDWLAQPGDKPIAFTPGSAMVFGQSFFAAAIDACLRLKRRGILLTRHAEQVPTSLPPGIKHVPFAPFGSLLPHCAALVHHGGVGTMAQALRAGIPQLMMPMSHDQFDNAAICRLLGVADGLGARWFTGPRVAKRLDRLLTSPRVQQACASVAARFRDDHPIDRVCELLEEVAPVGSAVRTA
jgi:UDP:flavonoid glycosyltransferase YjiC (YdhE family)